MTEITDHLADIRARVARAAHAANRSPQNVTIVAVSKQQAVGSIRSVFGAGQRDFGESYVQEALPKIAALRDLGITWHFIGALQANKTRAVAEHFQWVHTVDRAKIAARLSEQRPVFAPPLNVLIQVNQTGEPQKAGIAEADVPDLAGTIQRLPRLALRGLMCMPPADTDDSTIAALFSDLAAFRDRLTAAGMPLDTLSMGMSADFELAIAAGATCIRIGTAIFGTRTAD